ncbi:hypothetical protein N658DRAFT_515118 [Parathielavia hyrcaniae]|uniref:DUF1993 domain-containing protein n=1 Tax=Parathielavia hyrcaniae TaxID=113614 RepID=A0AAN6Q547_9PEZI|nr:hypothetical protein N658DRAFT_515118 [Parathielavia hyrcaniae]
MATISLYETTIGVSSRALLTMLDMLEKAKAHDKAHDKAASLAEARLYEDMLPFRAQVLIASNFGKKMVERLTKRELGVWEDDEKTLDELVARVQKTLDLLKTVKPEDLDAAAAQTQTIKFGPADPVEATTSQYVLGYALPNLFFHLSTAYGILRMKGLALGKADYITHFVADFFPPPAQK